MNKAERAKQRQRPRVFVTDALFLEEVRQHLTQTENESLCFIGGLRVGPFHVFSHLCPVKLENSSLLYARASAQACAELQIKLLDWRVKLLCVAHSQPGEGAAATEASAVDLYYQGLIQDAGADAIGLILVRSGHLRFFSTVWPFRTIVKGGNVI